MKQSVYVHSNGYDSILLVDDTDKVLSAWSPATKTDIVSYVDDTDACDWETGAFSDASHEGLTISDFGEELGRDGFLPEHRREFWQIA